MRVRKLRPPAVLVWSAALVMLLAACAGKGGTTAYTFHDVYIGADYLVENRRDIPDCEDIYLNEDGALTLVLTETQRRRWADPSQTEALLVPLKLMGIAVEYTDDYTALTISAPDGAAEAASPMILNFAWQAELYQVLNGAADWSLKVTVVNRDTGEIVQQVTLPEEKLDWNFVGQ